MRLLLDSQAFYWSLMQPDRIHPRALEALEQRTTMVWYSPINLWELAIKRAKGRLTFDDDVMLAGIEQQAYRELPVSTRHGLAAAGLPPIHADPFDRMLVAQARTEDLTLVTSDRTLRRYAVTLMEA